MLFDVVDVFIVGLYGPVILVTAMAWGISIYIGRITDGKTFDQIIILENKKKK